MTADVSHDIDFAALIEPVARELLGEPNRHLCKGNELRFGTHGSVSVDLEKATFYDFEAEAGGGVLDLIRHKGGVPGTADALEWLRSKSFLLEAETPTRKFQSAPRSRKRREVARYRYRDETGAHLFDVVRFESKDFRRQAASGAWSLNGVRRVLYRLPELIAADPDVTVFLVEGEKDADRLAELGLLATPCPGGAGKWRDDYNASLKGRRVAMASILPFEIVAWEKLFWFLKFLVPKLKIEDPDKDALDELLESVDLSSYGLQRTKLNHAIPLDASGSELDPQNPNPRGYRDGETQEDPLEEIIRGFNERWFHGWSTTPEEQRVKFLNIVSSVRAHPDFMEKFSDNPDPFSRDLAFEKIMKDVMLKRRKEELELYKLHAQDPSFKAALYQSIKDMLRAGGQDGWAQAI